MAIILIPCAKPEMILAKNNKLIAFLFFIEYKNTTFERMGEKLIDIKLIKQKIQHYCAIRERCQSQVIKKLKSYGASLSQIDELISKLKKENFIDEERFARTFCSGKFTINKWGKQKIAYELSKLHVSNTIIQSGMKEINQVDYLDVIRKLSQKKYDLLREHNQYLRKKKVVSYLTSKGYEVDLAWECINQL